MRKAHREPEREYTLRLRTGYELVVSAQKKLRLPSPHSSVLRDHFAASLKEELTREVVKEQIIQNPQISFLEVRDLALGCAESDNPRSTHMAGER